MKKETRMFGFDACWKNITFPQVFTFAYDFNVKSLNSRTVNLNRSRWREKWVDMTQRDIIFFIYFPDKPSARSL